MKNNIYKVNLGTIHRKAVKAGLVPGLFTGLLCTVCMLFLDSTGYRYNTAVLDIAVIGPVVGVVFGMLRAAYVWAEILLRFRGRISL